jgi:hypothetical protein
VRRQRFDLTEAAFRVGTERAGSRFDVAARRVVEGDSAERISIIEVQHAKLGSAEARGVAKESLKDRLQVAGRTGDDSQHLGCRRLRRRERLSHVGRGLTADGSMRSPLRSHGTKLATARSAFRALARQGHPRSASMDPGPLGQRLGATKEQEAERYRPSRYPSGLRPSVGVERGVLELWQPPVPRDPRNVGRAVEKTVQFPRDSARN